jgi:FkbM family methyltransferase
MQSGHFEQDETSLLQSYLPAAELFVDVGANVGFYTCLARSRGVPTVAFEPEMHNLRNLYRNLEVNGFQDTEVWPIGLADKPGLLKIYGAHTGASVIKGWAGISSDAWSQVVPVNTLDNVLGHRFDGKKMLIKIDVEGAELSVLRGARRILQNASKGPIWLVEITQSLHHPTINASFLATFELFWQYGYEARTADRHFRHVTPAEVRCWSRDGLPSPAMHNWYFARAS